MSSDQTPVADITGDDDIKQLVDTFYETIREDDL